MNSLLRNMLALALALAFPCCAPDQVARPPQLVEQMLLDRDAIDQKDNAAFNASLDRALAKIKSQYDDYLAKKIPAPPVLNVLIISGGGDWGAFGAGFLKGWTKNPDPAMARPPFLAVTGVSTGALIAPFAFLGDDASIETIVQLYRNPKPDWIKPRSLFAFLNGSESYADIPGLERDIQTHINLDLLSRIAAEGEHGRLLAVSATNIDSGEPRAFNMASEATAALAAKNPDRFHQILLASSAIPGAFPPREIDHTLYVDGGITGNILFARPRLANESDTFVPRWLAAYPNTPIPKIRYWIIFNNKLRYPPEVIQPKWTSVLKKTTITATHSATLLAIRQIFLQARLARLIHKADVEVRFVTIPNSWTPATPGIFLKETMNALADIGEKMGAPIRILAHRSALTLGVPF